MQDKKLRKHFFGVYSKITHGSGKYITLESENKYRQVKSDDGIFFWLLDKVEVLEAKVAVLEAKKK